jgi:hypothetical protein
MRMYNWLNKVFIVKNDINRYFLQNPSLVDEGQKGSNVF